MMKAGLQKLRQIVVLGGANQTWDVAAGQWTRSRVKVVEQQAERFRVEFNDGELALCQLAAIHLLYVGANAQPRNSQTWSSRCSSTVVTRSSLASTLSTFFS